MTEGHNGQLKSIIERAERLNVDRENIAEDLKELFKEAKANGWDVPTIRRVIKVRKLEKADRDYQSEMLATYMREIGE